MYYFRTALCLRAALVLVLIGVSSSLGALANRVFVSARSGNDANTCDNILAPCQTFAGAVTKLNPGGEAIVLDSGGYGPVTITQSLTLEAPPGVVAFIHPPSGDAITVNAGVGDKVVLRGLVLNGGPASGIHVVSVGTLFVENCVISGFATPGIFANAANSQIFVKDTISRQNQDNGIFIFSGVASIDHCRIEGNAIAGVRVQNATATIRDSVSAGNTFNGFEAFAQGTQTTVMNIYQSMSTNNLNGVVSSVGVTGTVVTRLANSSVCQNSNEGIVNGTSGGSATFESLGNNLVRGNAGGDTGGTITVVAGK